MMEKKMKTEYELQLAETTSSDEQQNVVIKILSGPLAEVVFEINHIKFDDAVQENGDTMAVIDFDVVSDEKDIDEEALKVIVGDITLDLLHTVAENSERITGE